MVSACGGLAFALSSLLKLSSYEAFLMPLPVLLCAVRNGGKAGRKAVRATFVLLAGKPCGSQPIESSVWSSPRKLRLSNVRNVRGDGAPLLDRYHPEVC